MTIIYSLTLEVIRIFQILTVFNTGERSELEKFDYKKYKQPLNPLSYPSNLHTGPHLWQISGGIKTMPLLPMLEKEACAQFYRDKNMWRNVARNRVLLNHFNNSGVT